MKNIHITRPDPDTLAPTSREENKAEKGEKIDKARKYIDDFYREAMLAINHANDLVKWYTNLRLKYARVCFMMETDILFLVVKWEEPYAKTVFDLIRDNEMKEGRWNNLDELTYQKFLKEWQGDLNGTD